jgi:hypothetical protein
VRAGYSTGAETDETITDIESLDQREKRTDAFPLLRMGEPSTQSVTLTTSTGLRERSGSGNAAAGVISGDFILRLPLDDFWPSVHLAPYILGGGGGVFTGAGGNTINTRFAGVNARFNNASSNVENNRGLGHIGGGAEYRRQLQIFGRSLNLSQSILLKT